ncbi:MAG: 30S ribosome-binding factor RbfA [Spirochaetes bacterium]|nr:30S ribosome-binding factor RbfA [Spirochaetota bacterium]
MEAKSYRPKRVGEVIKREIAGLFWRGLKDPRLNESVFSLVEVRMSDDLKHADIYVSILEKDKVDTIMEGLNSAKGFIKKRIASALRIKYVPEIHFKHDTAYEDGTRLFNVIEELSGDEHQDEDSQ